MNPVSRTLDHDNKIIIIPTSYQSRHPAMVSRYLAAPSVASPPSRENVHIDGFIFNIYNIIVMYVVNRIHVGESVLMGTECFNTGFSGSLGLPCYVRDTA